jgi:predicted GIY-YIG superfamily endonuclease
MESKEIITAPKANAIIPSGVVDQPFVCGAFDSVFIYGLRCPLSNKIRYIGKSVNPNQRFKNHINYEIRSDTHKARWLNKLAEQGLLPNLIIIEETSIDQWEEREKYWISYYKNDLTNETIGGDGRQAGWKHKRISVDKIINALRQRSKECRKAAAEKTSIKLTGSHASEIAKKRLSVSHVEYWNNLSDEKRMERTSHLLRVWTNENKSNLSATLTGSKHKNTTSKYKGVSWFKRDECWRSWIHYNGKQQHLGYFHLEIDAANAYDEAAKKYFGEFANLNFK